MTEIAKVEADAVTDRSQSHNSRYAMKGIVVLRARLLTKGILGRRLRSSFI